MMQEKQAARTIDEYIAGFPAGVQQVLQEIRRTIREAAPGAEEAIKYGLATFVLEGNLVHFGAFRDHIGFYPDPRGIERFREELAPYEQSKGTVRFPLDRPLPLDLIRRIVEFRVQDNLERARARKRRKGAAVP
jgi:uncharacterized protein YdhG (YjbR/CyaY superfamily)